MATPKLPNLSSAGKRIETPDLSIAISRKLYTITLGAATQSVVAAQMTLAFFPL